MEPITLNHSAEPVIRAIALIVMIAISGLGWAMVYQFNKDNEGLLAENTVLKKKLGKE